MTLPQETCFEPCNMMAMQAILNGHQMDNDLPC